MNFESLEFSTPGTMKLLGSFEIKRTEDWNREKIPHLGITALVLVHSNTVSNDYQHDSKVFYAFVPNKSFSQILDISPKNLISFTILNLEFS